MSYPATVAEAVRRRSADERTGLRTAQGDLTHAEVVRRAAARAAWAGSMRRPGPFHVAVLLDNTDEFVFWLQACALAGAVLVGANPTHRGDELVRDLTHTECQLLVTSTRHRGLLEGRDLGPPLGRVTGGNERVLVVDDPGAVGVLVGFDGAAPPEPGVGPETLGYLIFTSGTSGAPKAVRCTQGRLARVSEKVAEMFSITERDTCYLPMPLFHSNALMAGWGPALVAGATAALPSEGRFSASGFLEDVRRFGATYFNYVGKPLAYVLATPPRPDDADNPLVRGFGNEATPSDVEAFAARFACPVTDGYGSTEGGASVSRTPDTPPGALGRGPEGTVVLDPATGRPCPPARFDAQGRLTNAEEAIGELVSKSGGAGFEGYWHNDEAEARRLRRGWYWTGDLAFADAEGFIYFAGRDHEWLRVDGENFAAAPVERIVLRHDDVMLAAVYAVPDPVVGDQVMASVQLRPGADFDPGGFSAFLDRQDDLPPTWAPRLVRVCAELPVTATAKIMKRALRAERWHAADPVWWRPEPGAPYRRLTDADVAALDAAVGDRPW
ncbi:MAG TPA: AMP-binding protein [Acidimicrobiales bacterium]|nr:AMP-binding protein [Acidimicrobiales bacterium]